MWIETYIWHFLNSDHLVSLRDEGDSRPATRIIATDRTGKEHVLIEVKPEWSLDEKGVQRRLEAFFQAIADGETFFSFACDPLVYANEKLGTKENPLIMQDLVAFERWNYER